jgi:5'-nucleotidase
LAQLFWRLQALLYEKLFQPDLIISGINNGANLGYDILYSGTVSAAIEGRMIGFNSIAVSLKIENNRNFTAGAHFINYLLNNLKIEQLKEKILLNINIPDKKEKYISEYSITTPCKNIYDDHFEKRVDPMGNEYYWITGKINNNTVQNTDISVLNQGQISITPLKLKLTNSEQIKQLKNIL